MKQNTFFWQLLKDKDGNFSLRELVTMIFVVSALASWIAVQFFGKAVPEYIFYSFMSMVGAGCFGYSLERSSRVNNQQPNTEKE